MKTHIDVALIVWNRDVIELLSLLLHDRNLRSCGFEPSEGKGRIEEFILSHTPSVVVFDLGPPYNRSAAVAIHLTERFPDSAFVLTSADPALVLKKARSLFCHPMFQKPYEMDEMVNVVASMVRRAQNSMTVLTMAAG